MRQLKLVFAALVLTASYAASADPIVAGNGDISGLEVGGALYDVTWNFGTSEPSAADFPLFDGNQAFTELFMNAVLAAFVNSGFAGVAGQTYYGVDYANLTGTFLTNNGGSFSIQSSGHATWASFPDAGWGSVTASAVPEPGTLALLGIGLLGLGLSRRRSQAPTS